MPWATPFALRLPDNRTLIIRDHLYPLDDLYCYVNGWYSLPRHEVVNNFSYLEEVSNRWCDHLAEIVPGYYNITLTEFIKESKADEAFLENLMKNGADTGYVPQSVIDGMYLHAATKCVMRGHVFWIRFAMAWKRIGYWHSFYKSTNWQKATSQRSMKRGLLQSCLKLFRDFDTPFLAARIVESQTCRHTTCVLNRSTFGESKLFFCECGRPCEKEFGINIIHIYTVFLYIYI